MRRALFGVGLAACAVSPSFAQAEDEDEIEVGLDEPSAEAPPETEGGEEASEEPVRDPKAARQLSDGAAKLVKKADKARKRKKEAEAVSDYERALVAYERSFDFHPDPRVLVAAAGVNRKLERWLAAAEQLQRALAASEIPLDDKGRAAATAALDEAKTYLGVVGVQATPEGAVISIDGVERGRAPLAEPLLLAPGEYALAITADGFVALETRLVVEAGSESERAFELEPVPVVAPRPPVERTAPPPPELPEAPSKVPLIVGASATVVFAGLAVATGVLALGAHATFQDETASPEDRDAAQSSGPTLALLTDVGAALAVGAAGFTAYWYVAKYRPRAAARARGERARAEWSDEYARRPAPTPSLVLAPSVGGGGGGLVLVGRF